jgi:hypothetical protein
MKLLKTIGLNIKLHKKTEGEKEKGKVNNLVEQVILHINN